MSNTDSANIIQRVSSSEPFKSVINAVETPARAALRPSADEWYPRLRVGWNYAACVEVFCYFDDKNEQNPEIKWAIHPLGAPFRGKPDLFGFDPTPRLQNINCNQDMRDDLSEAVVRTLFARYQSQERFPADSPFYEGDEDMETLELWEKKQLDISSPGNMQKIQQAVLAKFDLVLHEETIKWLTGLKRFNTSFFNTYTWKQLLCKYSRPAAPIPELDSLKRKSREESEEPPDQSPSKRAAATAARERTLTQSRILQENLIVSRWLRQKLDGVEPHLQVIQAFLKEVYGIDEEDASFDKIRKMTDTADPFESPLSTRIFRGLAAAATTEAIPSLITPLGTRSRNTFIRLQTPPIKTLCISKAEGGD